MSRDLFGEEPAGLKDPAAMVKLSLVAFEKRETPAAFFLSKTGREAHGKYAPRSKVSRGVGPEINLWTMPRWLAQEKGWL